MRLSVRTQNLRTWPIPFSFDFFCSGRGSMRFLLFFVPNGAVSSTCSPSCSSLRWSFSRCTRLRSSLSSTRCRTSTCSTWWTRSISRCPRSSSTCICSTCTSTSSSISTNSSSIDTTDISKVLWGLDLILSLCLPILVFFCSGSSVLVNEKWNQQYNIVSFAQRKRIGSEL